MVAELRQLCELANEQIKIAHSFDTKFSDTAFTLLQKTHEAFLGTSGIAWKFIDDMATAGLNFIRDTTAYEAELLASDGMVFPAGLTCIWGRITELIREASALELRYKGAQKKFADILEWVGKEVKEYLDTQSTADCTTFMDESFKSLCILRCLQHLALHPSGSRYGDYSSLPSDFITGECVTHPPKNIPFASNL